ncbi:hypothetical protein SSCG_03205 [Streptomyces clavuligerus]|nr:hypothetical protein SSCG_03205 [Streptomyces clavuligerus]
MLPEDLADHRLRWNRKALGGDLVVVDVVDRPHVLGEVDQELFRDGPVSLADRLYTAPGCGVGPDVGAGSWSASRQCCLRPPGGRDSLRPGGRGG